MTKPIKYSLPEIERRWLVNLSAINLLDVRDHSWITDKYLAGTRMRLRRMERSDGTVVYKLCKKYGYTSSYTEPIVNVYLSADEYELYDQLPGAIVAKQRLYMEVGAIDRYARPHEGLAIFEVEFADEARARAFAPPDFVSAEITRDPRYSGPVLAMAADFASGG